MFIRRVLCTGAIVCLLMAASLLTPAQNKKLKDAAEESTEAAKTFGEIMRAPDKAIPRDILDKAECVAVFPSTIKGGFIVGAQKGDGVISCRTANGWSAPAYLDLSGGSVGLQIGGQSTDYVLLFMTEDGINSLLSSKLSLGADASVAAGPVGRAASASTDAKLNAQILSYSRSKGLFAGLELKGVVISVDDSDMKDVYGEGFNIRGILRENKVTAPAEVRAFPDALNRYSTRAMGGSGNKK